MTDAAHRHQAYWQGFRDYCTRTGTTLCLSNATTKYYYLMRLGKGFAISLLAAETWGVLRCELYLDGEHAADNFAALRQDKTAIEAQLGSLDWSDVPGRKGQHIVLKGPAYDPYDEASWEANYQWLKEQAERFHHTFTPYARTLPPH